MTEFISQRAKKCGANEIDLSHISQCVRDLKAWLRAPGEDPAPPGCGTRPRRARG